MLKIFLFLIISFFTFFNSYSQSLSLQGIIDFDVEVISRPNIEAGQAIHLYADNQINDLSSYAIGIANDGGGFRWSRVFFPNITISPQSHILLIKNNPVFAPDSAISGYLDSCFHFFDYVIIGSNIIDHNGNDAIELFYNGNVIETFGEVNNDGSGTMWYYGDSWAYKDTSGSVTFDSLNFWIIGPSNCTYGSTWPSTTFNSLCPYKFCITNFVAPVLLQNVNNITQNTGYSAIQTAIDSSNNGDTIIVSSGTYYENIIEWKKYCFSIKVFINR